MVNNGNYNASISSVSVGTPTCSGTDSASNNTVMWYGTIPGWYDYLVWNTSRGGVVRPVINVYKSALENNGQ